MPKYTNLHKVKVNTWGTKDKSSNGLDNFVDQELFGGSIGHASIEMTLPPTEETQKMIEKYCMVETFEQWKAKNPEARANETFDKYMQVAEQRIPVRLVELITPSFVLNADGELVKDENKASEISYYKIDFSFWPIESGSFYLSKLEEDMVRERGGHHFNYSDTAKEYLQPEERIHRGALGARAMTYAPVAIAHQRDMSDEAFQKVGVAIELQKLTDVLEAEDLVREKLKALNAPKIEGSLKKICQNMGLKTNSIIEEYMDLNPLNNREEVNIEKFKQFFLKKVTDHVEFLKAKKIVLMNQLKNKDIDEYLNQEKHITRGIPPDHTQELPYCTDTERGLSPEAMLSRMRELTEPDADPFNLHTKNCSKVSTAVLKAGAAHDPLLERVLGQEALGAIGTPQQVIGNAQRASDIIVHDRQNTLFMRIANSDILNRAMGGFIADYQKDYVKTGQKARAIAGIAGISLLKTPGILATAIVNPSDTMSDVANAVGTVFENANSTLLKIGVGILSAVPMTVLAPFALVEQGLRVLASPFKVSKNPTRPELDGQTTTPLPSQYGNEGNAESFSRMAGLLNERVANKINENTREAVVRESNAMEILAQFERDLEDPGKIVIPSTKDLDILTKYVREKNDPTISARFQKCCNQSLNRANKSSRAVELQYIDEQLAKREATCVEIQSKAEQLVARMKAACNENLADLNSQKAKHSELKSLKRLLNHPSKSSMEILKKMAYRSTEQLEEGLGISATQAETLSNCLERFSVDPLLIAMDNLSEQDRYVQLTMTLGLMDEAITTMDAPKNSNETPDEAPDQLMEFR
jgi:hypothetical protein